MYVDNFREKTLQMNPKIIQKFELRNSGKLGES